MDRCNAKERLAELVRRACEGTGTDAAVLEASIVEQDGVNTSRAYLEFAIDEDGAAETARADMVITKQDCSAMAGVGGGSMFSDPQVPEPPEGGPWLQMALVDDESEQEEFITIFRELLAKRITA